jgi:hypothetical protein
VVNAPSELRSPLVRVCDLLNQHRVQYLIVGGQACILHG